MKTVRIILIISICLASLCTLFLGFVFFVGSCFIFAGDIDLTDEQRSAAQGSVIIGSLFGVVLMLISLGLMIFSGVISKRILNLFGVYIDE